MTPGCPDPAATAASVPERVAREVRRERRHDAPRWRQIEIMRERQALQDMLDDFGDHDIDLRR